LLSAVISTSNQRLQIGDGKAKRVEYDPSHDDALEPGCGFIDRTLVARYHPDEQCDGCRGNGDNGADTNELAVHVFHDFAESVEDAFGHDWLQRKDEYRTHRHEGPIPFDDAFLDWEFSCHA